MSWREYRRAYRDCSLWLADVFAPWRLVLNFLATARDLRRNPPEESDA
jgi:hypothetical protein